MSQICLLTILSLMILTGVSGRIISEFRPPDAGFRNIVVDDENGFVYIGGDIILHRLYADNLTVINSIKTCVSPEGSCSNKILLMTSLQTLIVCGIDDVGKCALYNATDLTSVLTKNHTTYGLYVHKNQNTSAVALLIEDMSLYVGVTYDSTLASKDKYMYYPVSARATDPGSAFTINENSYRKLSLKTGIENKYLIYFRAAFQTKTHIYFLTNQKLKYETDDDNSPYISKLIRICKEDNLLYSYIDLEIECKGRGGEKFGLVQHGSLIELTDKTTKSEGDMALVATFVAGTDPKNLRSDQSAICLYKLKEIEKKIIKAQTKIVSNCTNDLIVDEHNRYLEGFSAGTRCQNASFVKEYLNCTTKTVEPYRFFISFKDTLTSIAIFTANNTILGKIAGRQTDGGYNELVAGTHLGNIQRIALFNTTSAIQYETLDIDSGQPIEAIHLEAGGGDYFLSSNKLVKVGIANCSQYTNCKECQASNNPHCGWCIMEERCTTRKTCHKIGENTWLSTPTTCISQFFSSKAVAVDSSQSLNITLDPFPSVENATYTCNFTEHNKSLIFSESATRRDVMLSCRTPNVSKHTTAELAIYMMIDSVVVKLASVDFRFYNCLEFSSCISCTSDSEGGCNWCVSNQTVVCATYGSCPTVTSLRMYNFTEEVDCPRLLNNTGKIFAAAKEITGINIQIKNLPAQLGPYKCNVPMTSNAKTIALFVGEQIQCQVYIKFRVNDDHQSELYVAYSLQEVLAYKLNPSRYKEVNDTDAKQYFPIEVLYPSGYRVDDEFSSTVEVYNCGKLGPDCSQCRAIAVGPHRAYHCCWYSNSTTAGCFYREKCLDAVKCEAPEIFSFSPMNGPVGGGTRITVRGRNFGISADEIDNITVAGVSCDKENDTFSVTGSVTCMTMSSDNSSHGPVEITVRNTSGRSTVSFFFMDPNITGVSPTQGPMAGGTNITISGTNLLIGNINIQVNVSNGTISRSCKIHEYRQFGNLAGKREQIICKTPRMDNIESASRISVIFDEKTVQTVSGKFTYLENPVIKDILPQKSMASGGIMLTIIGEHLNNAQNIQIGMSANYNTLEPCIQVLDNGTRMICYSPRLSKEQRENLNQGKSISQSRRRRSTIGSCAGCFEIVIKLDGFESSFTITYTVDPSLLNLTGDNSVHIFSPSKDRTLTLQGNNLLWERGNIIISIGFEKCVLVEVTESSLSCTPPAQQPGSSQEFPDVSVKIGNFKQTVGYLSYKIERMSQTVIIVIASIAGVLLLVLVMVAVICIRKSRHLSRRAKELEKQIQDWEMEIRNVSREEFADLQTSIKEVTSSLVERGFPYRDYQYYSFKMLFPTADMETHTVMLDPEVSDVMRIRLKKGMDMLEDLIYNKFFLKSLIQTIERQPQKKFSQRERILELLLPGLVQESINKKSYKALFRRCESVTEKLLMNLFSLCLYPYLKKHGSSLYMMFKAIQIRMEKGPIDQLTGHAKYTLSEDQLIKKQSATGNELVLESKPLKLSVSVLDQYYECIVLDCDTITQVKDKCLAQIYINFPASNRGTADDVVLEWHAGSSGCLQLHDLDVSNHVSDGWKRLNTLAHYNVWDGCKMALVETNTQEEDYVNLSPKQIQFEMTGASESVQLMPSSPQSSNSDAETPQELKLWHVVKPEDESQKRGKTKDIVELYLNRLLSMKISILPYIKELFDSILDANGVPTMVKTLYDLLDDLADQHKVDEDTLHVWKSHSYPIRFWAGLITKPDVVFDINKPGYTDQCLEIISQTFIDSFSTTSHNVNKESATHKLLFTAEMDEYRDKVHEFYSDVKSAAAVHAVDFQQDMNELNKDQNRELTYSKMSALYELFKVIDSFMVDVIDDLQESPEARTLKLADRLDELVSIIKESEEQPSYSNFPDSHV